MWGGNLQAPLQVREWFMKNGKVEDALRRLCGVKGEITLESLENRMQEVLDAIRQQNTKIDAEIAARRLKPPDLKLVDSEAVGL